MFLPKMSHFCLVTLSEHLPKWFDQDDVWWAIRWWSFVIFHDAWNTKKIILNRDQCCLFTLKNWKILRNPYVSTHNIICCKAEDGLLRNKIWALFFSYLEHNWLPILNTSPFLANLVRYFWVCFLYFHIYICDQHHMRFRV